MKQESKSPHVLETAQIITIDCGIGVIRYIQPDNLKLQMLMADFKEKQEKVIYQ